MARQTIWYLKNLYYDLLRGSVKRSKLLHAVRALVQRAGVLSLKPPAESSHRTKSTFFSPVYRNSTYGNSASDNHFLVHVSYLSYPCLCCVVIPLKVRHNLIVLSWTLIQCVTQFTIQMIANHTQSSCKHIFTATLFFLFIRQIVL